MLNIAPWSWFSFVPGLDYVNTFYDGFINWAVETGNRTIFHVRDTLVPLNGSGDTSFGWAQLDLYLIVALIGAIVWGIVDRHRLNYYQLDYVLRTLLRYYLVMIAMVYGVIKLFALQMPFPNLSQLATPLGDFLPMRFSWMFIGYSEPYQFFAGLMEVIVALLLLNRRTITLGLLLGLGVFSHVMILNYFYDIPVKLFSTHLVVYILYLVLHDGKRLFSFFIGNKGAAPIEDYDLVLTDRWYQYGRWILKGVFVIFFVLKPVVDYWEVYQQEQHKPIPIPFYGIYDVKHFVIAGDTIIPAPTDSLLWKDIIFDRNGQGSIQTTDTLFRQRYRRGYFSYETDTTTNALRIKRVATDSTSLYSFFYQVDSTGNVALYAKDRNDSLTIKLIKSRRHFQLTERQFHWLSEYNR